ncbi:hypothetical protein [Pantoea sp. R102]|uniref:hypothetical protein n=1 Tax=Pantoea sp. R102 TaxID=2507583 RepID=UPI0010A8FE9B|nr:hypothetical protein [Pantoea sp. R102]THD39895.1 hypothetical protein ERD80_06690 [Pantoea sp. R102]
MKKYLGILIIFITFTAKAITVQEFINAQAIIDSPLKRQTPPDDSEQQAILALKNLLNTSITGMVEGVLATNGMYGIRTGSQLLCVKSIDTDELIKGLTYLWDKSSKEMRMSIADANLSTYIVTYLEKKYKCVKA